MTTQELERCDTADAVLAHARSCRARRDEAEIDMYEATCTFAAMHTTVDEAQAAVLPGTDMPVAIAGPGAPSVSEFAIIEYGTALGLSADAAIRYVAHVVETRYRLPRLHTAVVTGRVPVWRARRIAEATLGLPLEAAGWVDHHLAGVAATCSYAVLGRLVEEALCRFDPEAAEDRRAIAAEDRRLDVRRSQALGVLARTQTTLDLTSTSDTDDEAGEPAPRVPARQVVLNVHLTDTALAGIDPTTLRSNDLSAGLHLAGVEETRSFVTTDQVCEWLRVPDTHVTYRTITGSGSDPEAYEHPFRQVHGPARRHITADDIRGFASNPDLRPHPRRLVDLSEDITTDGYTPSERLAEQTRLRHPRCVFPHCTRRARRRRPDEPHADLDHIESYDPGGPPGQTTSANLATLCRRHHRAKTHTVWTYRPTPTGFLWTSPHRYQYLVEPTGTTDLGRPPPRPPTRPV